MISKHILCVDQLLVDLVVPEEFKAHILHFSILCISCMIHYPSRKLYFIKGHPGAVHIFSLQKKESLFMYSTGIYCFVLEWPCINRTGIVLILCTWAPKGNERVAIFVANGGFKKGITVELRNWHNKTSACHRGSVRSCHLLFQNSKGGSDPVKSSQTSRKYLH